MWREQQNCFEMQVLEPENTNKSIWESTIQINKTEDLKPKTWVLT